VPSWEKIKFNKKLERIKNETSEIISLQYKGTIQHTNKQTNEQAKRKTKREPSIMLSRYAEWLEVYRRVLKPPKF